MKLTRPFELSTEMRSDFVGHSLIKRRSAYKFCQLKHREGAVREGVVRVGSLSGFRALENKALADAEEGIHLQRADEFTAFGEFHPGSIGRTLVQSEPENNLTFENVIFETGFDFATFCFSYDFNEAVFQSLCDKSNAYDACFEITDLYAFGGLLTEMARQATGLNMGFLCLPVIYGATSTNVRTKKYSAISRAFRKAGKFSPNVEGRIVICERDRQNEGYAKIAWEDGSDIFQIPPLSQFVRRIEIPAAWQPLH